MADGLGKAPGGGPSHGSNPYNARVSSHLSNPSPEQTNSSSQLRLPDLVRDSKLETYFPPDSSVETVHTYHEPDHRSRRRLVSRSEHWRRYGKIGGGSYGSVWLEKCTKGARRGNGIRAIKQMEVHRQSTRVDYNRELEAIAKFSHPKYEAAFVKSFGWYESPDHLFIAMEYLQLGDLHTYLHDKPPLPEHEAKEITSQILDGLFLMHDNGFAHRDMKPRNILLKACPPDDWWVKIADFGISKRIEDEIGPSSTLKGTQGYIAPELLGFIKRGTPYAPDLWAVGEIAFQMLIKQPTFKNVGVLSKYISNHDTFPSDLLVAARVGQSGQACILSLMHPDPVFRTTAGEALQHAWFNEALPSRQGSVKSTRNAPLPVLEADTGIEELATWNTIATQESEGASSGMDEAQVGTWSSSVSQKTRISPESNLAARFSNQSFHRLLSGPSSYDEGRQAFTTKYASPRSEDLKGEAPIAGRVSNVASTVPTFQYLTGNIELGSDTIQAQVGSPGPWNAQTTSHEPQAVAPMQPKHLAPSLRVHVSDDDSEAFIFQPRETRGLAQEDDLSSEPSPGDTPRRTLESKSKMGRTIKNFVSKLRSTGPAANDLSPYGFSPAAKSGPRHGKFFGVSLNDLYIRDGIAVPMVVAQCIACIEKYGLGVDGIYSQTEKQDIMNQMVTDFEAYGPSHDLMKPVHFQYNVKNAASLLRRFFRLLPNPLLTQEHYSAFINAAEINDNIVRRDSIHAIVNSLPDAHYATLRALSLHVHKLQEYSHQYRKKPLDLEREFQLSLLRVGQPNTADSIWRVRVIETIFENTFMIFDGD